jgi:hypothetical protein
MQKKIKIIVVSIFLFGNAFGQVPCNEPTLKDYNLKILSNLVKTQIPYQTLYDAVYPFADLEGYTGTTTTDTSNGFHFLQAYSEIYNSRNSTFGYVHPSDFYKKIANITLNPDYYHLVGIIDYQFATIKSDAVSTNLLTLTNGELYDVPNRPSSPYETQYAQIAAVVNVKSENCFRPGNHYFHFDSEFTIRNTGFNLVDITSIQIFFDNSLIYQGAVAGLEGRDIPFIISNANADIAVKMVLTTANATKTYRFIICTEQRDPISSCSGEDIYDVTGTAYAGFYPEGSYGARGRGTIYYADANCAEKKITKPIIFVDGFDPTNEHDGKYIYETYLNKKFRENGTDKRLGSILRTAGYDLIIYDELPDLNKDYNTGGGGYIEHNGMALAKFLNQFYNLHSSTIVNDFVVVGASMGGLITRYALTYSEYNNIPHHTRLFVAFDSPQNGAQIPIGVQNGIDKFIKDGVLSGIEKISNAVHQSNAAKQLLLHHSDANSETPVAHPYREQFYQQLASIGNWPSQCRMVSIACGNGKGKTKNIAPVPASDTAPPLLFACAKNLDIGIKYRFPIVPVPCNLDYCYKMRLETYLATSNNRCLALDYSLNNTRLLNLVGPYYPLLSKKTYSISGPGGNLDIAPGARFGTNPLGDLKTFHKILAYIISGPFIERKNDLYFGNFIPTTSAAAYTFPNGEPLNYNKDFTGINLSRCAGTTPFDTVYLQNNDLAHVEIDSIIASTFRSEIYFPKPKSICTGPCPEYVTLGTAQSPSLSQTINASKAIIIEPKHYIPAGAVFTAQIGCVSAGGIVKGAGNLFPNQFATLNNCPFEYKVAATQVTCSSPALTRFKIFVQNLSFSPYAEFSIDGISWNKANLGSEGHEWLLISNPNQPQVFYARPHNRPNDVISINLNYCNN